MRSDLDISVDLATPTSGAASILKQGEPVASERNRALLVGGRTGLLIGILAAVVVASLLLQLDYPAHMRRWAFPILIVAGTGVGSLVASVLYLMECKSGFLRVDDERIVYRRLRGTIKIPLEKVFGAAPEKRGDREFLRICFLKSNKRGFAGLKRNFKAYEAVSGPITRVDQDGKDGNQLAREAIMLHIKNRLNAELPVAELPEYRFISTIRRRERFPTLNMNVDASFMCDGRTLGYTIDIEYETTGAFDTALNTPVPTEFSEPGKYEIPVTMVRHVDIIRGPGSGAMTYQAWLTLDPASGHDKINLDLGHFTKGNEIERYCLCLPTLFPPYEDTEFWRDEY